MQDTQRQTNRAIDRITIGRDAALTYRVLEGIRHREARTARRSELARRTLAILTPWRGGEA